MTEQPLFAPSTIQAAWDETPSLRGISLQLGARAPLYRVPGQYVAARVGERQGYFALSSAPSETGIAELLAKRGSPLGDELALLEPGQTVALSAPQGKGFPVEQAKGKELILIGAGSGVGPLRAVIQHVMAGRSEFGPVTLFYGQRDEGDFAYVKEHGLWLRSGVEIVRVCSQPKGIYEGPRGYVQDALRAQAPNLSQAVAFLSGSKALVAGATEALRTLGMAPDRIHLNY